MKQNKNYIILTIIIIILVLVIIYLALKSKDEFKLIEPENTIEEITEDKYSNLTEEQIDKLIENRSINNVTMQIKLNTLTKEGATIIILDKNDYPYVYGESYTLEKLEDGEWKTLEPKTLEGQDIGYKVNNDGILEMNINWKNKYGELENGNYRISKQVVESDPNTIISTEFEIK